jgi:hypothetical protein
MKGLRCVYNKSNQFDWRPRDFLPDYSPHPGNVQTRQRTEKVMAGPNRQYRIAKLLNAIIRAVEEH